MGKAIGIDLGTTNSCCAFVSNGKPQVITYKDGSRTIPSVFAIDKSGNRLVGNEAKDQAAANPDHTIAASKRLIGRSFGSNAMEKMQQVFTYELVEGESSEVLIKVADQVFTLEQISAAILRRIKESAEDALDDEVDQAVITVPAYFNDRQRQAVRSAGKLAGLKVLRVLNEPTAAALAYGLGRTLNQRVAIYDLGGGTFDISLLRMEKGVFQVLATGGDAALGGDDFDHAIASWIITEAGLSDDLDPAAQRSLMQTACAAKEALTDTDSVEVVHGNWKGALTRAAFDALIEPMIARSLKACRRAVRDCGIELEEVEAVVMVGGSTRVPRVRDAVAELFGRQPLTEIDPDQVVAIGAAIQADTLAGNKRDGGELLLLDVIPLSLGLETMGGLMEKVIPRNTTIPVARAQEFTTYKDGQSAMMIHVLQGERELISDCRSLARFDLRGIPAMVAGAAKIRVTFQVDADGLLSVSARELASGVESSIQVKPSYGLTDGEITRMLKDSFQYAGDDKVARVLREQQVDAQRLIEAVEGALQADGERLLDAEERMVIDLQLDELRELIKGTDGAAIEQQTKRLSQVTDAFAARRLDSTVKAALSGRNLNEIEE